MVELGQQEGVILWNVNAHCFLAFLRLLHVNFCDVVVEEDVRGEMDNRWLAYPNMSR